jgi:hypothetical protein
MTRKTNQSNVKGWSFKVIATVTEKTNTQTQSARTSSVVTEADLSGLPPPVQRYMNFTGVVGKPWINTVHLKYTGKFRMALDKPWMPIHADQVYTTNPPGFLWKAQFKFAGLPLMFGTDSYKAGHSHMQGKVAGLFTVVDGQGDEVDQGTSIRYLQEMTWFPIAYLGENISWKAVDDHAADVTLHDNGKDFTGRMYFDDAGRLLTFVAQRYGDFNGSYQVQTWTTPTREYGLFCGLKLPVAGLGVWQLASGDFSYVDVHLTAVEYNQPIQAF